MFLGNCRKARDQQFLEWRMARCATGSAANLWRQRIVNGHATAACNDERIAEHHVRDDRHDAYGVSVYGNRANDRSRRPAGGIVEATSRSTLAMLPMHEPLIAQLFGAEMADALTTGCQAVAIASGTYPTSYTPASLSQLPASAQALLASNGWSVDTTGCVTNANAALNGQAPIVAYEPGGTSATYRGHARNCSNIASLGLPNPGDSGAQVFAPVIPGSTGGSCSVIIGDPNPPANPTDGNGLVKVEAIGPCINGATLAIGDSCLASISGGRSDGGCYESSSGAG